MTRTTRSFLAGVGVLALARIVTPSHAETYRWVQYGPGGLEARAITDAATCPAARIDGQSVAMTVRAAPGTDYPVTTCATPIPAGAKSLSIAGQEIGLPSAAPKRIAVIGDTGCRLKGIYVQWCNDPAQWPFKQLAETLAKAKPDLIIHVGDYHYRESACPLNLSGCANSPHGDNWAVWKADFFAPAAALLPVAPWVVIRGNHEDCQRGGKGWSRTLDPMPFDAVQGCNGPAPLYSIKLPQMTLAVVDTAIADEPKSNAAQAAGFRTQYQSLASLGAAPLWLLQHRPIWSAGGLLAGNPFGDNKTLAVAAQGVLPQNLTLMLSGHHHVFQVLNYASTLPAQIVSGHGGDYLNGGQTVDPKGWNLNGATVSSGLHDVGTFGYVIMEPSGNSWSLINYGVTGQQRHACTITGRQIDCKKPS